MRGRPGIDGRDADRTLGGLNGPGGIIVLAAAAVFAEPPKRRVFMHCSFGFGAEMR